MKPVVAIIGRPNVGKSRLFNRIVGQRISIVADTPGVTRDRLYRTCKWNGRIFDLVDTAGIDDSEDIMSKEIRQQVDTAIEIADLILFVVDFKVSLTMEDKKIADRLRKSNKEVIMVVNKYDEYIKDDPELFEYYELGLDFSAISADAGIGIGDLLDKITEKLPVLELEEEDRIKVALIGRPNVGKSSIINKLAGKKLSVVTNQPGTTRDAVDTKLDNKYGKYNFIDTAGLRRKSKVTEEIERYSMLRTYYSIDRADVVLVVLDVTEGVSNQDLRILGLAHEEGKAIVILANKWDLIENKEKKYDEYYSKIRESISYASYAPIMFISATDNIRIDKIYEQINKVYEANTKRLSTSVLNKVLFDSISTSPPSSVKGQRLKIYYMSQVSIKPPTFLILVNDNKLVHFSYRRYIINQLRQRFDFEGTSIRLIIRTKKEKE